MVVNINCDVSKDVNYDICLWMPDDGSGGSDRGGWRGQHSSEFGAKCLICH